VTEIIRDRLAQYYRDRGHRFGVGSDNVEKRVRSFIEGKQATDFISKIQEFCPKLKEASILDVGCGPGRLVKPLRDAGYNITGVEYDNSLVEMGNLWVGENLIEQGSAYELPHANNTFDVVVGHDLLEHLPYPDKAFHEMVRVCKPGGHVYIVSPNRMYPREPHYSIFPFPSFAPKFVGALYLRLLGRNPEFFVKDVWPITYWKLRRLVSSYCTDFVCLQDRNSALVWRKNMILALLNFVLAKFKIYPGIVFVAKKDKPNTDYAYSYKKDI
jgi:SAM-dependent methyltransferase